MASLYINYGTVGRIQILKLKIQYLMKTLVNTQNRVFKSLERKFRKYSAKGFISGEVNLSENP